MYNSIAPVHEGGLEGKIATKKEMASEGFLTQKY